MIGFNDSSYYRMRAEQAERLAAAATMPAVRAIHSDMAIRYAALAEASEPDLRRSMLKLAC